MEYLNDLSESLKLIPSGRKEVFNYRKVVHYGLTEIEPYLWVAEQASRLKMLYNWPEGTYEGAIFQVRENIVCVWQWVEAGGYIANSGFTLADIYFYHLITWAKQHHIEFSSCVSEYLGLLEGRPAFPVEMSLN
jgi:glutathione S-transferase